MSNNINHEIKTIVAELQSMSPRTQLEIVRLCKRVAELTPDYIEDVTEEITDEQYATFTAALNQAKTELQSQITTNANDIDALEVRTGDAEDNIDSLQTRMSTAEDEIASVKTRMSSAETSIQTNANDIDALEVRMDDAEDEINREVNARTTIVNTTYQNSIPTANFKAGTHALQLKGDTGELLLDGNSIEKHLYFHKVGVGGAYYFIYNTQPTAMTFAQLCEYVHSVGDYLMSNNLGAGPGTRYFGGLEYMYNTTELTRVDARVTESTGAWIISVSTIHSIDEDLITQIF